MQGTVSGVVVISHQVEQDVQVLVGVVGFHVTIHHVIELADEGFGESGFVIAEMYDRDNIVLS